MSAQNRVNKAKDSLITTWMSSRINSVAALDLRDESLSIQHDDDHSTGETALCLRTVGVPLLYIVGIKNIHSYQSVAHASLYHPSATDKKLGFLENQYHLALIPSEDIKTQNPRGDYFSTRSDFVFYLDVDIFTSSRLYLAIQTYFSGQGIIGQSIDQDMAVGSL